MAIEPMTIEECNGIEPGKDNCYYRIIFEENSCTIQNKCDHLLVYWSGGEQNIMSGHYDSLMKFWAKNDYVAVVANLLLLPNLLVFLFLFFLFSFFFSFLFFSFLLGDLLVCGRSLYFIFF